MQVVSLEQTRAAWDAIATGYDRFVTANRDQALPELALRRAGLKPGMRFLDVACGSGALSIPAARLGARVVAVDLSPAMIAGLQERAAAAGLRDVEARVMDGHVLEFEDDAFDIAGSQFGVMLFPDLPRGLAEMVRVTRPGGRVLMVVFGRPEEVEFLTYFVAAMRAVLPGFSGLPADPPPLPFQMADPDRLRRAMADAGLRDIQVEPELERLQVASGTDLWNWTLNSNPIPGELVSGLTEEQRRRVQGVLDGMLRERSDGRPGGVLHSRVYIACGTK